MLLFLLDLFPFLRRDLALFAFLDICLKKA